VCESQKAIIQQLKDELVEAENATCISEANLKALEADLIERLQYEVEQVREPKLCLFIAYNLGSYDSKTYCNLIILLIDYIFLKYEFILFHIKFC